MAIGIVDPRRIKTNRAARSGDVLVLGKGLGVGIYSAAMKQGRLPQAGYEAMIASTTRLNTPGIALGGLDGVHAMTDVTGFGLLGHALELARGSRLTARITYSQVPVLPGVRELALAGLVTGAGARNWAGYGSGVELFDGCSAWQKAVLTDPQTSGGLLVTCAPESEAQVLALFRAEGVEHACRVGWLDDGPARVVVTP